MSCDVDAVSYHSDLWHAKINEVKQVTANWHHGSPNVKAYHISPSVTLNAEIRIPQNLTGSYKPKKNDDI
jgi:hypothetical protein